MTGRGARLATIKGLQNHARKLTVMGVKMSTFGILHMDGQGDDVKPGMAQVPASD
jgi:hypothetical protein